MADLLGPEDQRPPVQWRAVVRFIFPASQRMQRCYRCGAPIASGLLIAADLVSPGNGVWRPQGFLCEGCFEKYSEIHADGFDVPTLAAYRAMKDACERWGTT